MTKQIDEMVTLFGDLSALADDGWVIVVAMGRNRLYLATASRRRNAPPEAIPDQIAQDTGNTLVGVLCGIVDKAHALAGSGA